MSLVVHNSGLDIYNEPSKFRKTSIICTIGPKTKSVEMLTQLREAGMSIVRMNFSHGSYEYHGEVIANTRASVKQHPLNGRPVGIALDTKGPEIRTGLLKGDMATDTVNLKMDSIITVTTDDKYKEVSARRTGRRLCYGAHPPAELRSQDVPGLRGRMLREGLMGCRLRSCYSAALCLACACRWPSHGHGRGGHGSQGQSVLCGVAARVLQRSLGPDWGRWLANGRGGHDRPGHGGGPRGAQLLSHLAPVALAGPRADRPRAALPARVRRAERRSARRSSSGSTTRTSSRWSRWAR